jgi:hypothetical protein
MKTARQNTRQEKLFVFSLVYLTGSTPFIRLSNNFSREVTYEAAR